MIGIPYGEKNFDNMFSRFHTIPACYGQTDRRTDRIAISISRVSVVTRDKKQRDNCAVRRTLLLFNFSKLLSCHRRSQRTTETGRQTWSGFFTVDGKVRDLIGADRCFDSRPVDLHLGRITFLCHIQAGAIKTGPPSHCKYSEIP